MFKDLLKKREGFTLIEIVLVLAIAGLIVVIVFLAVQGAQRSRRDTVRRDFVNRLSAGTTQLYANNNGVYDCDTAAHAAEVAGSADPKPAINGATMTVTTGAASTTNVNVLQFGSACLLSVTLENGGTYTQTVNP